MKISEFRDEEALELLANISEPAIEIFADKELVSLIRKKESGKAISVAIKNHKREVMALLAALEGVPVEDFHCNVFTLPGKLLEILSDKELMAFFSSTQENQGFSGNVTENTEETGEESEE